MEDRKPRRVIPLSRTSAGAQQYVRSPEALRSQDRGALDRFLENPTEDMQRVLRALGAAYYANTGDRLKKKLGDGANLGFYDDMEAQMVEEMGIPARKDRNVQRYKSGGAVARSKAKKKPRNGCTMKGRGGKYKGTK